MKTPYEWDQRRARVPGLLLALTLWSMPLLAGDNTEQLKTELRTVEREFETMAGEKGIHEAFVHFAADDAVFFDVDPQKLRGPAALEARRSKWWAHVVALKWRPVGVDVAASGDLGYTWGTSEISVSNSDGTVQVIRGLYVSVWKRDGTGKWHYVLDTGSVYPTAD
jgi:ketosteroid isomerase-like protein